MGKKIKRFTQTPVKYKTNTFLNHKYIYIYIYLLINCTIDLYFSFSNLLKQILQREIKNKRKLLKYRSIRNKGRAEDALHPNVASIVF